MRACRRRDFRLPLTIPARVTIIVLVAVYLALIANQAIGWFNSGSIFLTPLGLLAIIGPSALGVWARTSGWSQAKSEYAMRRREKSPPEAASTDEGENSGGLGPEESA